MAKVMRAIGVTCASGHAFVTLEPAKAKMNKETYDRFFHGCRPHKIVKLVDATTLVGTLRGAMKRHGCKGHCDVCRWAAYVIGIIWKDAT